MDTKLFAIGADDASALLPAMLEGVATVVGQFGGVRMTLNAKDAAVMFRVHGLSQRKEIQARFRRGGKLQSVLSPGSVRCLVPAASQCASGYERIPLF